MKLPECAPNPVIKRSILLVILWGLICCSISLQARPLYKEVFIQTYPNLSRQANFKGCYLCHAYPIEKLNAYGKAIKDQMPTLNMNDTDRLRLYLRKAAEYPSKVEGKTFGDFIKNGKLPSMGCNVCTLE